MIYYTCIYLLGFAFKGCYSAIEDFINKYSNIFIGIGVVVAIFEVFIMH